MTVVSDCQNSLVSDCFRLSDFFGEWLLFQTVRLHWWVTVVSDCQTTLVSDCCFRLSNFTGDCCFRLSDFTGDCCFRLSDFTGKWLLFQTVILHNEWLLFQTVRIHWWVTVSDCQTSLVSDCCVRLHWWLLFQTVRLHWWVTVVSDCQTSLVTVVSDCQTSLVTVVSDCQTSLVSDCCFRPSDFTMSDLFQTVRIHWWVTVSDCQTSLVVRLHWWVTVVSDCQTSLVTVVSDCQTSLVSCCCSTRRCRLMLRTISTTVWSATYTLISSPSWCLRKPCRDSAENWTCGRQRYGWTFSNTNLYTYI